MKLIRHKQRRKGVLVPLLEDLFQRPVEPETEDEIEFIADILRSQIRRQDDRNYRPGVLAVAVVRMPALRLPAQASQGT
jgi:hypothetical protein